LTFLTQVIIDKDIPRESRQPFYDEYIAKGGNGTVIKFWLENKLRRWIKKPRRRTRALAEG
jgi:hypothetical protein